ncbi:MAG: glycosyltransferase family 4 protein [Leeuwenhoekiella sp.]
METGGIESHILEFCKNLKVQKNAMIDLIIPNSEMSSSTAKEFDQFCNHVFILRERNPKKRLLWLVKVAIKLSLMRYDALYTNGLGNSVKFISNLFNYKKWVHHHHTSGDIIDQSRWSKHYIRSLISADNVIACSTKNAQNVSKALNRTIDYLPCFSRQFLIPAKKDFTKPMQFGYFGRLIPEKGIDILCRLSEDSEMKDIHFNIWGEGEKYEPNFFNQFKNLKYQGKFSTREELQEVLQYLDAFILLTTHSEGLPISLLECMSAGLPWLATNKGGIPDIACDPIATRVVDHDISYPDIKIALLQFVENIQSTENINKKQMQLYQSNFSATALAEKWKNVLTD